MATYEYDVLIIGCGVAGLSAGAKLAEKGLRVGIATRASNPNDTNTFWAQGGIVYNKNNGDIIEDLKHASSNTMSHEIGKIFAEKSAAILEELLLEKAQTDFERTNEGELKFTREAAHSHDRILFKGDYTGREIQVSMLNYLNDKNRFPNVTFLTSHTAIDLLTPPHHGKNLEQRYEKDQVIGAYLFDQKNEVVHKALAKKTILATGGVASMYIHHSNSEGARGDGHAMAKRAGVKLINMEFIQFHPTTFFDRSSDRRFLISEAVRGEGGILRNSKGEAFMENYHPEKEMAPRDVVSRSIDEEMIRTKHECVYLDISEKDDEWIQERFPTIFNHCLENGVDIRKESIPVVPAAHYTCGGVKTNEVGRTSLENLYAVGEVACTGLHGANRLASTSLAEGLTWGYMAAEDVIENIGDSKIYDTTLIRQWVQGSEVADPALIHQDMLTLKQTMWNYVGLTRTDNRLNRAYAMFRELYDEIQRFYKHAHLRDDLIGLRNSVEVGFEILNSSRRNNESVGCFYRKRN